MSRIARMYDKSFTLQIIPTLFSYEISTRLIDSLFNVKDLLYHVSKCLDMSTVGTKDCLNTL